MMRPLRPSADLTYGQASSLDWLAEGELTLDTSAGSLLSRTSLTEMPVLGRLRDWLAAASSHLDRPESGRLHPMRSQLPNADAFDLQRFVTAQQPVLETALAELRAGRKRTHWMWFVFPQFRGLGKSSMAIFYGIRSLEEARAYLQHPELGAGLVHCTQAVLGVSGASLLDIFGSPDDLKFRSSMTLFALATGGSSSIYHQALDQWCHGEMDPNTVRLASVKQGG